MSLFVVVNIVHIHHNHDGLLSKMKKLSQFVTEPAKIGNVGTNYTLSHNISYRSIGIEYFHSVTFVLNQLAKCFIYKCRKFHGQAYQVMMYKNLKSRRVLCAHMPYSYYRRHGHIFEVAFLGST